MNRGRAKRASSVALLAAAFTASCASPPTGPSHPPDSTESTSAPPSVSASATAAAAPQRIEVTFDRASDTWDVSWTFTEPTRAIVFDRRDPSNRHETWRAIPGLRWVMVGPYEQLEAEDGKERTTFGARFSSNTDGGGRAPPLNVFFSNGDRLLFTAQVGVHAIACPSGGKCDRRGLEEPRHWTFHAGPGEGLRVLDHAATSTVEWDEPAGDVRGTYAYAGSLTAERAGAFDVLVDPGLPTWLREETSTLLPRLVEHHAKSTGIALDVRPLVFASRFDTKPGSGLRGRTLPALIQLEAIGAGWDTKKQELEALWFEFLAHETFHLWNAQLARRGEDPRNEWLSEGSAVFAAGIALRDAGLLDAAVYDARILKSANTCRERLKGPLFDEKASDAYYACGEVLLFAIDRDLGGGAMTALATLFNDARAARIPWETKGFRALVDPRLTDETAIDVRAVLDVGLGTDASAFLARLLRRAGLDVEATTAGPLRMRPTAGNPHHL